MNSDTVAEERCNEGEMSERGVPAKLLLDRGGPHEIGTYLTDHPLSARRIQGEMSELSLLGTGNNDAKNGDEHMPQIQEMASEVTAEAESTVITCICLC